MIKKSLTLLSVASAFYLQAQDVSTIKNTIGVYSNTSLDGSSKYNAMAGSMGALGGDISVLNSNPAGLGIFITNDISGTLSVMNNKNATTFGASSLDYTSKKTNLGQTGGVLSFPVDGNSPWKFVNLGVSYSNKSLDDYSETSASGSNISLSSTDTSGTYAFDFLRHAYDRTGIQSKMSFGLAGNYDNKIYIGAGMHFHYTSLTQYDTAELYTTSTTTGETTAGTEGFSKQNTPFNEDSNGFSANIGIIGKVNNQFRLGASLETPTWWNMARTYNYYNDANTGDGVATEDRKLASPMKATLSAAFVPNKNFALNVDYTLGLTKPKYQVYGDAENELNTFFSNNYKNLSELKIGGEFRIQAFRLRAGYAMATNPLGNIDVSAYSNSGSATGNSSYSDLMVNKRNTLGLGIGYDFKAFYLDAAFQNITSQYSNPFLYGSDLYNSNYFSDYHILPSSSYAVSSVKNTQNNFFITLGWKF